MELILARIPGFVVVLLSLTVHEWAHAFAAFRLGDDTARGLGRMTLDPLAHIDPIGTLILPLLGVPFGWAKPVPVNPVRFTVDTSVGMMVTAAAGPLSNLALAALGWTALGIAAAIAPSVTTGPGYALVEQAVWVNVALAVFNLLPIPPLDGSRIVDWLVSDGLRPAWDRVRAGAPFVLGLLAVIGFLVFRTLWSIWEVYRTLE